MNVPWEGFTADLDELERCRRVMQDQAQQFNGISNGFAAADPNPPSFGTLPAAIELAGTVRDLHSAAQAHFVAARQSLWSVADRLHDVRQRMTETDISNANALTAL